MQRLFYYSITLVFLAYAGICAWLYNNQEALLFLPKKLTNDYVFTFRKEFVEIVLDTPDGERLHGLHFKAETPKGIILYFHGNAGALDTIGFEAAGFVERGYDVVIPDYRSYGKSSGSLSEKALYEDAKLFYRYVEDYWPANGTDDIIIYGRSIGTGVAAYLASQVQQHELILVTPYYSMSRLAQQKYPLVPVSMLLRYPLATDQFVLNFAKPIYIFHGTKDRVIPYQDALDLKRLIGDRAKLITVEGSNHNSIVDDSYFWLEMEKVLTN